MKLSWLKTYLISLLNKLFSPLKLFVERTYEKTLRERRLLVAEALVKADDPVSLIKELKG